MKEIVRNLPWLRISSTVLLFVLFSFSKKNCLAQSYKVKFNFSKSNDKNNPSVVIINGDTFFYTKQITYKTSDSIITVNIPPKFTQSYRVFKDTSIKIKISAFKVLKPVKLRGEREIIKTNKAILTLSKGLINNSSTPLSNNDPIALLRSLPGINSTMELNSGINIRGSNFSNTQIFYNGLAIPNIGHSFGLFSIYDISIIDSINYYQNQNPYFVANRGIGAVEFLPKYSLSKKPIFELQLNPFNVSLTSFYSRKKLQISALAKHSILANQYYNFVPLFSEFQDININTRYHINDSSRIELNYINSRDKQNYTFPLGLELNDTVKWLFDGITLRYSRNKKKSKTELQLATSKKSTINLNAVEEVSNQSYNESFLRIFKSLQFKNANLFSNTEVRHQNINYSYLNSSESNTEYVALSSIGLKIKKSVDINAQITAIRFLQAQKTNFEYNASISKEMKFGTLSLSTRRTVNNNITVPNNLIPAFNNYQFLVNQNQNLQLNTDYTLNWQKKIKKHNLTASLYYQNMPNEYWLLNFSNNPFDNTQFLSGIATNSYGLELLNSFELNEKVSGYASYTLSRTRSLGSEINNNLIFPANHDRPHQVNLNLRYTKRRTLFNIGFTLQSGRPITLPLFQSFGGTPIYSSINEYRLPLYHRMDIGMEKKLGKRKRKIEQVLKVNIYNVYFRRNTYAIYYTFDRDFNFEFFEFSAFPFLPSISYTLKINP